jgi:OmpA-OmpF porin, OOP family
MSHGGNLSRRGAPADTLVHCPAEHAHGEMAPCSQGGRYHADNRRSSESAMPKPMFIAAATTHPMPHRATAWKAAAVAVLLAGAALMAPGARAQTQDKGPVLRENQVTEKNLIEALKPAEPAASEPEVVSRSLRIATRPAAAVAGTAAPSAAAQQGKRASILVTFLTDSAELSERAKSALDVLAGAMKSDQLSTVRFTIEGHADPRGSAERNQQLSQARADSVRQYLIDKHGLGAERVSAVGKGSSALMDPANPAAPENRRVTIVSQQGS